MKRAYVLGLGLLVLAGGTVQAQELDLGFYVARGEKEGTYHFTYVTTPDTANIFFYNGEKFSNSVRFPFHSKDGAADPMPPKKRFYNSVEPLELKDFQDVYVIEEGIGTRLSVTKASFASLDFINIKGATKAKLLSTGTYETSAEFGLFQELGTCGECKALAKRVFPDGRLPISLADIEVLERINTLRQEKKLTPYVWSSGYANQISRWKSNSQFSEPREYLLKPLRGAYYSGKSVDELIAALIEDSKVDEEKNALFSEYPHMAIHRDAKGGYFVLID